MSKRSATRAPYSGADVSKVQGRKRAAHSIWIAFDDEMFAEIRQRATEMQTSFAEQVRCLVERGLEQ